ncbi:hypothetical protein [Gordonia rubripertincta]|uniref:Major facilitator superfamily (MFS) profile domain-containing protein n=1 Tax=Gordonia rubripertincta TaxID=36822 RepID=A0ABT4MYX8_GORRU|nr:hypothetical protein [Gordonia rubripertincta]MCZ4552198.1 hypothetical protein [Gordonia rubripertincta]
MTKSVGIIIGTLILLLGVATYGLLLCLYAFTSFLLFSQRWAPLGWAILSGALVGVGFAAGYFILEALL